MLVPTFHLALTTASQNLGCSLASYDLDACGALSSLSRMDSGSANSYESGMWCPSAPAVGSEELAVGPAPVPSPT